MTMRRSMIELAIPTIPQSAGQAGAIAPSSTVQTI